MSIEGLNIMVVEDEPLIALDIIRILESAGAIVTGPVRSTRAATRCLDDAGTDARPAAVVLDFQLTDGTSENLAIAIAGRNIPIVFHTGNSDTVAPLAERLGARLVHKPASDAVLLEAVTGMATR